MTRIKWTFYGIIAVVLVWGLNAIGALDDDDSR